MSKSRAETTSLVWVPSHIGIDGNEQADRLANAAIQIRLSGARYRYRGLGRDPEVDRYVLRKWQEEWEKQSTAVSYRRLEPVVGQRERFRFGSRTAETTAHRLRFVKCAVNAVLYTRHAQARHWAVRPLRGTGDGPAFFAGMLERFSGWRETAVRHLQAAAHDRSSARRRSDTAIHLQNGRSSSDTVMRRDTVDAT
jgi:hypothetical protein